MRVAVKTTTAVKIDHFGFLVVSDGEKVAIFLLPFFNRVDHADRGAVFLVVGKALGGLDLSPIHDPTLNVSVVFAVKGVKHVTRTQNGAFDAKAWVDLAILDRGEREAEIARSKLLVSHDVGIAVAAVAVDHKVAKGAHAVAVLIGAP